jgi:hypothetical protein
MTKEQLFNDLTKLGSYYSSLMDGDDGYIEEAYNLMYSYGLTDKDGFWIYGDD